MYRTLGAMATVQVLTTNLKRNLETDGCQSSRSHPLSIRTITGLKGPSGTVINTSVKSNLESSTLTGLRRSPNTSRGLVLSLPAVLFITQRRRQEEDCEIEDSVLHSGMRARAGVDTPRMVD